MAKTIDSTNGPNYALIHERCNYPAAVVPKASKRASDYEWKFEDSFGNRYGRFFFRSKDNNAPAEQTWIDVFLRNVHLSEFFAGQSFAVATIIDESHFAICRVRPAEGPKVIFRSVGKVELHGISPDEKFLLVQVARNQNWFRPEVLVLDLDGHVQSRLAGHREVDGCWAGAWAPTPSDQRIIIHHEATGFAEPAIWSPFENELEELSTKLEGEVRAKWDRSGHALLLHRTLNGLCDLHRMDLRSKDIEPVQPLDGVVLRYEVDDENAAVGVWAANHMHVRRFRERERFVAEGFHPSVPLAPWTFRRIAGVPCFVVGTPRHDPSQWTIFDGYGDYAMHYSDGYWAKVHNRVDHGFLVIMVNTRGCNGFGRAWREATAGNLGLTELEDMRRVRAALVEESLVDAERTIITGESWGGYMTLLAMGTQPELWRMGIAGLPVGDWERLREETTPLTWAVRPQQFGGTPELAPEAYRKASPLRYAENVRGPILMVVGKHDLLCPPQQNIRFADAVRGSGCECELYLFEGAHGAPTRDEFVRQQNKIIEFLLHHCRLLDGRH